MALSRFQGVAVELGITSQTVFSTIWLVAIWLATS